MNLIKLQGRIHRMQLQQQIFAISLACVCVWVYLCEKSQNKCDTQTNKQTEKHAKYISIAADDDYYYYCSPCFSPSLAVSHSPPSPVLLFVHWALD